MKDVTNDLNKRVKGLQKTIEDMNISINEKEAEIIRLTLCWGDEKKKNSELMGNESTPKRRNSMATFQT